MSTLQPVESLYEYIVIFDETSSHHGLVEADNGLWLVIYSKDFVHAQLGQLLTLVIEHFETQFAVVRVRNAHHVTLIVLFHVVHDDPRACNLEVKQSIKCLQTVNLDLRYFLTLVSRDGNTMFGIVSDHNVNNIELWIAIAILIKLASAYLDAFYEPAK